MEGGCHGDIAAALLPLVAGGLAAGLYVYQLLLPLALHSHLCEADVMQITRLTSTDSRAPQESNHGPHSPHSPRQRHTKRR